MTKEQTIVTEKKISDGYSLLGESASMVNGLVVNVLVKGKHTLAINSLGYDEHYIGKTWKIN